MKKMVILSFLCLTVTLTVFSQGGKKVVKQGIQQRICYKTNYETGDKEYKESVKFFDAKGNTVEEIEYDVTGKEKSHKKYVYNENDDLVKETKITSKGAPGGYTLYEYDGKKLSKEIHYDSKGVISKTIQYSYSDKLKVEETEIASNGKPKTKQRYEYVKNQ